MKGKWKRVLAALPSHWQQELRRRYYRWQIRSGRFRTEEKEYQQLASMVSKGDWVIDIGANIGHYTVRLSQLVGSSGRVIAVEPVPATFDLLASNVMHLPYRNVTLLNVAASDRITQMGMKIPKFSTGLNNYYMAHLSQQDNDFAVLSITIDSLAISHGTALVKVDTEGHDFAVLNGMAALLERDHPILIVEDDTPLISEFLQQLGYASERLKGSHNQVFRYFPPTPGVFQKPGKSLELNAFK